MVGFIYPLFYLFIFYISVGFGNIGVRRSYVVKEVEKLKQNRELLKISFGFNFVSLRAIG